MAPIRWSRCRSASARRSSRPRSGTAPRSNSCASPTAKESRAMQGAGRRAQGESRACSTSATTSSSSPRPRRPEPARAAPSRSASTTRIDAIAAARGDVAPHTGDEQAEGGGKKGDTLVEIGAAAGAAAGPDRVRGQGQAALEERRPGPSSTAAWTSARGDLCRARRRRARTRSRPGASSSPSTRATS